jgi:hypothetical protein
VTNYHGSLEAASLTLEVEEKETSLKVTMAVKTE